MPSSWPYWTIARVSSWEEGERPDPFIVTSTCRDVGLVLRLVLFPLLGERRVRSPRSLPWERPLVRSLLPPLPLFPASPRWRSRPPEEERDPLFFALRLWLLPRGELELVLRGFRPFLFFGRSDGATFRLIGVLVIFFSWSRAGAQRGAGGLHFRRDLFYRAPRLQASHLYHTCAREH